MNRPMKRVAGMHAALRSLAKSLGKSLDESVDKRLAGSPATRLPRRLAKPFAALSLALASILAIAPSAAAQTPGLKGWITSWATSTQDPLPAGFALGNPPANSPQWAQMFPGNQASNQTFRLIIRPQAGGDQVRLRFSNLMGNKPVTFDKLSIAQRVEGKAINVPSRKLITFGGANNVTLVPGQDIYSDPIGFSVAPEKDVAVTFHVVGDSGAITWHAKAMTTSYMSGSGTGDKTEDSNGADLQFNLRSWVWLTELQSYKASAPERRAIVAIGDSITDGSGTTIDGNDRWTDFLNKRLRAAGSENVVVNEGIGGNRVTTLRWGPVIYGALAAPATMADFSGSANTPDSRCDGCGEPAVARLERDALGLPNVAAIILYNGVNDIGGGGSYGEIIAGMQDIALRAHARGVKVYGVTITPYYGFAYDLVYPDITRRRVNEWMKTTKVFDAIFDFDAVARDPAYPARIKADLEAPDHIHLNPKGYSAVADTVPLSALDPKLSN
jgi:lysophospholipase L1-like esterase